MTGFPPARSAGDAPGDLGGATAAFRPAEWLCLAATPTFALMALLTTLAEDPMDGLCPPGQGMPLSGMATMYLLMSAFHAAPWLRRISGRRLDARRDRFS